jgi:general stress protein 26
MTTDPRRHLIDLMEGFSNAMMITRSSNHSIHARPMAIAELGADGMLYFATSLDSGKLREIEADPSIALTLQDSSVYISILGTAHISTDRALIDRLWKEPMLIWFPKGKDDPSLVILKVDPQDAEYWDNSGTNSIGYAVSALKAYVHGQRPELATESQHAKVML